ncbi:putative chromatin remodeler Bromodomain family [Medicago truncatula]|uniref:Putative chromatin remodeler Bromodomain family n=1 Tax=Medicago truncatula TaxID=3880 RepID=A0A396JAG4_MEDTR|nr:putative chromatin remodeler Bromodomain family [Medicago truncatula]
MSASVSVLHSSFLEKQVKGVEQFYKSTDVQQNDCKLKGKEKSRRASEDMHEEIMRNFNKILNEASASTSAITIIREMLTSVVAASAVIVITQDKWAWPFLEPVDVKGLRLDDYYQIIEKPMDFSTIRTRMKAKDGSGYKNVREIYADVRLIFHNAMKYNHESHDVHVMAKTLLEKVEKKWLHLLPKVAKAESELSKEEAQAQEAAYANMTRELGTELSKIDMALTSLKTKAIAKCRKLTLPEKSMLANAFNNLSLENRVKALAVVRETNPDFDDSVDTVMLNFDSQSDYTMLRLYMFVKDTLEVQEGTSAIDHEDNIEAEETKNNDKKRKIM